MKNYHRYTGEDLTFVICAYGECRYLEDCIQSVKGQAITSKIIISTSTPNDHIKKLAKKYDIPVRVNPQGGQVKDYNFAFQQANTDLVMLMHQDEILDHHFAEKVIAALNHAKRPIIAFTDYLEMHNDKVDEKASSLVKAKRVMLLPAKIKFLNSTWFTKRLIQLFGNPITHPTVVCVRKEMPSPLFREQYKACMDWDLWERLSRKSGDFVYVPDILLYHRMNDDNQSAKLIKQTNCRNMEELEILERFWPKWIARKIARFYSEVGSKYY